MILCMKKPQQANSYQPRLSWRDNEKKWHELKCVTSIGVGLEEIGSTLVIPFGINLTHIDSEWNKLVEFVSTHKYARLELAIGDNVAYDFIGDLHISKQTPTETMYFEVRCIMYPLLRVKGYSDLGG